MTTGGCGNAPPASIRRGIGGHVDVVLVIGDGGLFAVFGDR